MERMTSQRKDILEALGFLGHASFHTVFDYLISNGKKISLSTLYRNISSLEDDKYIRKVDLINGDEIMYELTRLDEHEHFVCTKCGRVIDIFNKKKHRHYDDNGNLIEKTSITYYGVCKDCLKKEKEDIEA